MANEKTRDKKQTGLAGSGASEFRGVMWSKSYGKWVATITHERKQIHLGQFDSDLMAGIAYDLYAFNLKREKASLNFPTRMVHATAGTGILDLSDAQIAVYQRHAKSLGWKGPDVVDDTPEEHEYNDMHLTDKQNEKFAAKSKAGLMGLEELQVARDVKRAAKVERKVSSSFGGYVKGRRTDEFDEQAQRDRFTREEYASDDERKRLRAFDLLQKQLADIRERKAQEDADLDAPDAADASDADTHAPDADAADGDTEAED